MLKVESEREDDGRWIAEVPALPGVLTYGETEAQARARVPGSRTANRCRERSPMFLKLHEPLAGGKGPAHARSAPEDWLVHQTTDRRTLQRPGYTDYVFAFHERDEIGPRMLARIARHTGLRPEDL